MNTIIKMAIDDTENPEKSIITSVNEQYRPTVNIGNCNISVKPATAKPETIQIANTITLLTIPFFE